MSCFTYAPNPWQVRGRLVAGWWQPAAIWSRHSLRRFPAAKSAWIRLTSQRSSSGSILDTTSPVTPNYGTRLQVQILRWPDRCRTICRTGWMIIRKYVMPSGSPRQSDCTACWTGPASLQASLLHLALVQPQCPRFRLHET